MIPSDQQDLLVGKLISGTQSGGLRWTNVEFGGASTSSQPKRYLECRSDGLIFRLSKQMKLRATDRLGVFLGLSRHAKLFDSPNHEVVLEVIDKENPSSKEKLRENRDLPALRQLYEIASEHHEALQKKLTAFLGKKAG